MTMEIGGQRHDTRRSIPAGRVRPAGSPGHRYLVLGAGCAALSLVWHMLDAGITDEITLIDQRREYTDDRTWCYWSVEPTPFDDLADHSWSEWEVTGAGARAVAASASLPYLHLRSERFYRRVLDRLAEAPNVRLLLGRQILDVTEAGCEVVVRTSGGDVSGDQLFDSIGWRCRRARSSKWEQHFRGQRIRTVRPIFDPSRLTLMDHRLSQKDGPHFVYVLPFSETEALVENTYLFAARVSPTRHRAEIADYLARFYHLEPGDYEVISEEHGIIPMGDRPAERGVAGRILRIGLAGGAARPATGYAFLRIQRQSRAIAQRIARGESVGREAGAFAAPRYRLFDAVMLAALARSPHLAPSFFVTLFRRAPVESVVRFLTERSSPLDDLWIIRSLLKWDFVRMLLCLLWRQSPVVEEAVIEPPPLPRALPR